VRIPPWGPDGAAARDRISPQHRGGSPTSRLRSCRQLRSLGEADLGAARKRSRRYGLQESLYLFSLEPLWHSSLMAPPPPFGADEYVTATEPMSLLRLLKGDLRHGRNLDLYILVGIAVVVATLGVVSVVDSRILAAATLAVLAMMATSTLASRHQVDGVRTMLVHMAANEAGNVPAERFLSQRHAGLDAEVATATHIGLVGVTLTRTVRDLLPVLDRRLQAGARVRVLLIDLESQAHQEAVARSKKADAPDFYRHRVSSTVDLLRVLASTAADQSALQLRVLPFVPTFGMCLIDPGERHGRVHVEVYQHRTLEPNPSFSIHADRDGRWYDLFSSQFDTLWDSARTFSLTAEAPAAEGAKD